MYTKKGFTRSDMIMTVVCIVVLITIINAVGTTGSERAKIKICQNNLKQLGGAMNKFAADNDGEFANSYYWLYARQYYYDSENTEQDSPSYTTIPGQLSPYMENPNIQFCPTFARLIRYDQFQYNPDREPNTPVFPRETYSMNSYLGNGRFGIAKKIANVTGDPSRVMVFTEENCWRILYRDATSAILSNNDFTPRIGYGRPSVNPDDYPPERYHDSIATYHNALSKSIEFEQIGYEFYAALKPGETYPSWDLCRGSGNVVFLDGHVELVPYTTDGFYLAWPFAWE